MFFIFAMSICAKYPLPSSERHHHHHDVCHHQPAASAARRQKRLKFPSDYFLLRVGQI